MTQYKWANRVNSTPLEMWSEDNNGQRSPMTIKPDMAGTLPDCVLEDMAQYHDVECGCVYCVELRKREEAGK